MRNDDMKALSAFNRDKELPYQNLRLYRGDIYVNKITQSSSSSIWFRYRNHDDKTTFLCTSKALNTQHPETIEVHIEALEEFKVYSGIQDAEA